MIGSVGDLAELFSLFHDGVIVDASGDGHDLELRVRITYLAERIAPGFTTLIVHIHEVEDLAFVTWPKEPSAAAQTLRGLAEIFAPPLEILSGEVVADRIEVVCNQPAASALHCGGMLAFRVTSADVIDQNGKHYSLAELAEIADAYWKDWTHRTSRR